MAGFKITVGLDDTQITRDAKVAAEKTADAFDDVDIGGVISKSARSGFEQVGKDAKTMAAKAANELEHLPRRGVFTRLHEQARAAFTGMVHVARSSFSAIGGIIQNALGVFGGNLISGGLSRFTGLLKDGATRGIEYRSTLEKITTQLTVLTGSASVAAEQIKEIKRIADATPFAFPDLAQAAATLQSFGFSAEEVEDNLNAIADAGARITGTGSPAAGLQTISLVLGQIRQSTRLTMEDVRQLTSRGLPVFAIIGEQIGKTAKEAKEMFDTIGFSGETAQRLLVEGFKMRPDIKGFSDELGKTFEGRMSTAADALEERLGEAAKNAFEEMKKSLDLTIELLKGEGGDKLVKSLQPAFEEPVKLMNKALEALKAGNFEEFGKDVAKEFLKGLGSTIKDGLSGMYDSVFKPAIDGIKTQITGAFTEVLNDIKATIERLSTGIENFFNRFKLPGISFEDEGAVVTPQNVVWQGGRRRQTPGNTRPQIPGNQQLPRIIDVPPAAGPAQPPLIPAQLGTAAEWAANERNRLRLQILRLEQQTGGADISKDTLPGVEALEDRTGALKEQTATLDGNTEATKKGTEALKLSAEQQAKNLQALLLTGEAAKQVFDFGLRQTFEGMVSSVISGTVRLRDAVSGAIAQIRSRVGDFIAQGLGNLIFGGGGTGGAGGSGTGGQGGGGGGFFGSLFGGLFGGGGSGAAGSVAGAATGGGGGGGFFAGLKSLFGFGGSSLTAGLTGPLANVPTIGAAGAFSAGPALGAAGTGGLGAGLFGAGGFLAGLASAGPLIGFAGGTALGGKSLPGQILGGIGGTIAGAGLGLTAFAALGGTLATTGFAGAAAALLTNPFTIAIGGALLIGAYFLGKAKERKQDEQQADAIWVNEREQTRAIIAAVNSDRMDGAEALAAHAQLRGATIAQLNQIKTKSVRESRLKNQLRDLDNSIVRELQEAVARQAKRRGIIPQLIPEFAGGGRVPGIDRGVDSVLIKARPGEVVLNQAQQARLTNIAGAGVFQRLGIPPTRSSSNAYQGGGFVGSTGPDITISLVLESDGDQLGTLVAKGMKSSTGSRATVRVMDAARRNGEF
jgi:tape measure domain-containing protein